MDGATGAAVEHPAYNLRSTAARSRRWDALGIAGEGTLPALEIMSRGVAHHTRSRVPRPPRGQVFTAISDETVAGEVLVQQRCNEQQNSLHRTDRATAVPQTSVRGTSVSSVHDRQVRATRSQVMDVGVSHNGSRVASARQVRSGTRGVPYTRVGVANAPRSHVRETSDIHNRGRVPIVPAARNREANGPARNGREMSITNEHGDTAGGHQPFPRPRQRSHVGEMNVTYSHGGEPSAPGAQGREADSQARNGRGMSVTDEHGDTAGGGQPCPRLRPRTSADRDERREIRSNSLDEEREPHSQRQGVERPNSSVPTGNRRTPHANWRTQVRQYMDDIFAAYVNAMLFGNQKREVKDLPEVAINEEQVHSGLKCSVCLLDFVLDETVHKLPCDHMYHKNCIIPWLEQNNNCPMCRRTVQEDETDDDDDDDDDEDDEFEVDEAILPDDDSINQRTRFRIVVGDANVTVIARQW